MIAAAPDAAARWLYRAGGISALVLGVGYVLTIPLYLLVGAPPHEGEAWLAYGAGKTAVWSAILALSVFTDLLYIPLALALHEALRTVHRSAILIAVGLILLFVVLDLAVTWPSFAALISLSDRYAAATSDLQRAYRAEADYASVVLSSTLEGVYAIGVPSLGILIAGLVMRRGDFGRVAAYVGVATGVAGILSVVGALVVSALSVLAIVTSLFTTIWVFLVGYRLVRMGGR